MRLRKKSLHDICVKDELKLSLPSEPVTLEEGKGILDHLHSLFNPKEGVGLAAPQVGIHKRVCIIHIGEDKTPHLGEYKLDLINPWIKEASGEVVQHRESCFSVSKKAEYYVKRHEKIVIEDDLHGETTLTGFPAFVAQHEIAHLNGETIKMVGTPVQPQPIRRQFPKIGRNDPCACGSEKKFKKCCGG